MSDESNFDPKKFKDDLRDQIHRGIHARSSMTVGTLLHGRGGGGMVTGAIFIVIGLAFLLDHLGIISISSLWRFWPVLLVLTGFGNFMSQRRTWGALLMFAGVVLQLNTLGLTHFGWAAFWPMMLIAFGLLVMWGSLQWRSKPVLSTSGTGDPRTTLSEAVVFGGLERRMTSQDFQGGEITAIFGGVELDLTEANIQTNDATLAITAIFGGVEVRVPRSWQVVFRGAPIFGGVEDKTRTTRVEGVASSDVKTLVITGAVIFGGLEIKN